MQRLDAMDEHLEAILHTSADGGYAHTPPLHDDKAGRSAEIRRLLGAKWRVGSPTRLCTLNINRICPHGRLNRGMGIRGFHEAFVC